MAALNRCPSSFPEPSHFLSNPGVLRAAAWAGWMLLGVFSIGAALGRSIAEHPRRFELLYAAGFVGYLLLIVTFARRGEAGRSFRNRLLIGAVMLRLPLLAMPVSDDACRYLWEGRVQLAGHNPYALPPNDPRLTGLRDEHWDCINHPSYTAVYLPLTMMSCALVVAVWPEPVAFKLLHTAADVLAFALLLAWLRRLGKPIGLAAVYGLCPLTLTAFAAEGHNDSLMIAAAVGAGYALACGRNRTASLLLGVGMSCKLVVGLAWFWLARRHRLVASAALALLGVSFLPYVGAGLKLFDSLYRFGTEGCFLSFYRIPLIGLLERVTEAPARLVDTLSALLLLACVLWSASFKRFGSAAIVSLGALLLTSPVVHYWYLTWVLAFVAFRPGWAWVGAAGAMGLYFEAEIVRRQTGVWAMPYWVGYAVWGTFVVCWVMQKIMDQRGRGPLAARFPMGRG
jgi:hypothetical protein